MVPGTLSDIRKPGAWYVMEKLSLVHMLPHSEDAAVSWSRPQTGQCNVFLGILAPVG